MSLVKLPSIPQNNSSERQKWDDKCRALLPVDLSNVGIAKQFHGKFWLLTLAKLLAVVAIIESKALPP